MHHTLDEKSGLFKVTKNGFTYVVDGYNAESVMAYNDKGETPIFIREYELTEEKKKELDLMSFAQWEELCNMAWKLASKN